MIGSFRIKGAKQLEKNLRDLPKNIAKNVLTRSLREVAKPIAAGAASRAKVGTDSKHPGRLKAGFAVSTRLSKRQRKLRKKTRGETVVYVGAPSIPEAITQEFGTGPRFSKKGKYSGAISASPSLRPAWEAGKYQAMSSLAGKLRKKIEAAARRLAKRSRVS